MQSFMAALAIILLLVAAGFLLWLCFLGTDMGRKVDKYFQRKGERYGLHRRPGPQVYGNSAGGAGARGGFSPPVYSPAAGAILAAGAAGHADQGASPRACEDAGIVLGAVEAVRCWRHLGNGYLASINGANWVPGQPMMAVDVREDNDHGVHAFKKWGQFADGYVLQVAASVAYNIAVRVGGHAVHISGCVMGRVKLWGRIIEHEHGYRAECALPIEISDGIGIDLDDIDLIRRRYGLERPANNT